MNKTFQSSKRQGPAINNRISAKSVRVISEKGEMLGVLDLQKALSLAFDQGLDLVEVSPNASPPVCKIIDYGKYKYQIQKNKLRQEKNKKLSKLKRLNSDQESKIMIMT